MDLIGTCNYFGNRCVPNGNIFHWLTLELVSGLSWFALGPQRFALCALPNVKAQYKWVVILKAQSHIQTQLNSTFEMSSVAICDRG